MTGMIEGGWAFVWAAYGITAAAFVVYTVTLIARLREAKRHD